MSPTPPGGQAHWITCPGNLLLRRIVMMMDMAGGDGKWHECDDHRCGMKAMFGMAGHERHGSEYVCACVYTSVHGMALCMNAYTCACVYIYVIYIYVHICPHVHTYTYIKTAVPT